MQEKHPEGQKCIVDVLHDALPEQWRVTEPIIQAITECLNGQQYWKDQYKDPNPAERRTIGGLQRIQAELLEHIVKPRPQGKGFPKNVARGILFPGRDRSFDENFGTKERAISWQPDAFTMFKGGIKNVQEYLRKDPYVNHEMEDKKPTWCSVQCIFELKSNPNSAKVVDAKYELILRGSAALNDNPFRQFVPLVFLRGGFLTFMICDRSGIREWPAIDTRGEGIQFLIKILAWLLFATTEDLGFFEGIGASSEIGAKFQVQVPVLGENTRMKFDVHKPPLVQSVTDVIDHRATTVFEATIPGRPKGQIVLKVAWSHNLRPFEGSFLRASESAGIKGVPKLIAGDALGSTKSHARGFLPQSIFASTSGTSKIRPKYTSGAGGGPSASAHCSDYKYPPHLLLPAKPPPTDLLPSFHPAEPKRGRSDDLKEDKQNKRRKLDGGPADEQTSNPLPEATLVMPPGIQEHYESCQRTMGILVTPYCGVSLMSTHHRDHTPVTYYEIVLACMRAVNLITTLFTFAVSNDVSDSKYRFPGMHRDISLNNIMVIKAAPVNGQIPADDGVNPLIDFEFAAHPGHVAPSGAPRRTGTMLSMAIPLLLKRPPFHRPFFDFESVFWTLYYRLLSPLITSEEPTRKFEDFADKVHGLGDAGHSADLKRGVLIQWEAGWKYVQDFEARHGKEGASIVWVLLTGMKRFLFQRGKLLPQNTTGYDQSLDDGMVKPYYPGFDAKTYEDGEPDLTLGQLVSPWGDDPLVVQQAGNDLGAMFIDALAELTGLAPATE